MRILGDWNRCGVCMSYKRLDCFTILPIHKGRGLTINLPIFDKMIEQRNEVSKKAAIQAMSLGDDQVRGARR